MKTLKERLKEHEGFRSSPYRDDRGNWTIGHGHFLGNGQVCKISPQVADLILDEDIHLATFMYNSLGLDLDDVRRDVCINMIFWHGLAGFMLFKKMLHALEYGNWDKAADEMMDSNSGREYKTRMSELSDLMRHGC